MDELKKLLQERSISQDTLAAALNIHRVTVNEKLNGKAEFSLAEIVAISKLLRLRREEAADLFLKDIADPGSYIFKGCKTITVETDEEYPTPIVIFSADRNNPEPIKIFGSYRVRQSEWDMD